ncbi:flavodoxin [Thiorhodococcus fuscus]|uniref:Flavodoxin n=1 Tax=Thiorhodococcus fuscus TaxID=527200 RepID=A0ABW4YCR6_9GAMM
MKKIGLFFATDTGNTRKIAKKIQRDHFEEGVIDICNFEKATAELIDGYEALIFGTPTLGVGEYPQALEHFLPELDKVDFSSKVVALYGLGDQEGYSSEFVDALGMLHEEIESRGAQIVGAWPTDGYEYELSRADLGDGNFCGLVLDLDNQASLTDERLASWISEIKPALLAAATEPVTS